MSMPLFQHASLPDAFAALHNDLVKADGPQISTMRNYRFAILQYLPQQEFKLRAEVQKLTSDLIAAGWIVFSISLHKLLIDRVRAQGGELVGRVMTMERQLSAMGLERGLNYLKDKLTPLIKGPDGIAADCSRVIGQYVDQHPDRVDRMLAIIGRILRPSEFLLIPGQKSTRSLGRVCPG